VRNISRKSFKADETSGSSAGESFSGKAQQSVEPASVPADKVDLAEPALSDDVDEFTYNELQVNPFNHHNTRCSISCRLVDFMVLTEARKSSQKQTGHRSDIQDRRHRRTRFQRLEKPTVFRTCSLIQISLQIATNNFSKGNLLGEGGFGRVYKGTFDDGTSIAIKKLLNQDRIGPQEFKVRLIKDHEKKHSKQRLVHMVNLTHCLGTAPTCSFCNRIL
jgi:hypothetical protein